MAIIYTYPPLTALQGSDLLLISDTSTTNSTKSVTLANIASYVTGTGSGTYGCPPMDPTSPWYTFNPLDSQAFCDSDWCVDSLGNPTGTFNTSPYATGPHPDCICCPTFDCINGNCIENTTGTGTYANKILCLLSTDCTRL